METFGAGGRSMTTHRAFIKTMAVSEVNGRFVVVTTRSDEMRLQVLDLNGTAVYAPLDGYDVRHVAVFMLDDRLLIAFADGARIRLWEPAVNSVSELLLADSSVMSLVIGRLGPRKVIVFGTADGIVRVLDPDGRTLGGPVGTGSAARCVTLSRETDVVVAGTSGIMAIRFKQID
jgi:hypothetical protein